MTGRITRIAILLALISTVFVSFASPINKVAAGGGAKGCTPQVEAALKWLPKLQNDDGGFSDGFKPESSLSATAQALYAIAVAHYTPDEFKKGNNTPLSYLTDQVKAGKADTVGKLGLVLLAVEALPGDSWQNFGGVNLVKQIDTLAVVPDNKDVYGTALAAIATARITNNIHAIAGILLKTRNADGGWGYAPGQASDTNSTAVVLQALIADHQFIEVKPVADYLMAAQNKDFGWPYQQDGKAESDANSTTLVLEALNAAGKDHQDLVKSYDLLNSFAQKSGAFAYQLSQPADNFLATVQAIPEICASSLIYMMPTR